MSTLERITLTPALAAELLLGNKQNRPLRRSRVNAYAHDMAIGAFDGRAVHIYVGHDGTLYNGQHTCTAVVESGASVRDVLIERGVDASVMDHLDRGLPRSVRDALSFRGAANTVALGSIMRQYVLLRDYRDRSWTGQIAVTESDLLALYEERRDLFDRAATVQKRAARMCGITAQYGVVAAYVDALDSPEWQQFDHGVQSGENLVKGDPRLTLRNWVHSQDRKSSGAQQQQYRVVCITRAWNAWVRDEALTILKWPGRALPMPEPIRLNVGATVQTVAS
jgi:hypothetical protein